MSNSWLPPRSGTDLQPLQISNSSAQRSEPETPAQRQAKWNASLGDGFALTRNGAAARQLFEEVANGFAPPDDARQAQAVFNDLIEREAYDTFAEVFNAYNAFRAAHARAPGEPPFKATLTLQLPQDWRPNGHSAFLEMLKRVPVERLEVIRPEPPLNDASTAKLSVPATVCEGIVELLAKGTAELVVRGVLASPAAVVLGLGMSTCRLRSLALGEEIERTVLRDSERQSYEKLMDGVADSTTLENLSFDQPGLIEMCEKLDALAKNGVLLKSINVVAIDSRAPLSASQELRLFAESVKGFKALTSFSLKCNVLSQKSLVESVLQPLRGHDALVRLDIQARGTSFIQPADMGVAPEVLNFSRTCPSLRDVTLQAIQLENDAGRMMALNLNDMPAHAVLATNEFARDPRLHLASLTMIGVAFTPDFTAMFSEVLADNDTLVNLNLSGCHVSITMAVDLPEILANHKTIRNCWLPKDPGHYYFEHGDRFHDLSLRFDLWLHHLASDDEAASAQEDFAKIRALARTAPTATQAMLDAKHREAQRAVANEALALNVGGVLQMATSLQSTAFNDIAKGVLPYLVGENDAKALRDVVHLSEVGKPVDHHKLHAGGKTPESVKVVVGAANADAVAKGLPTAPLAVNTVDAQRRNKPLREAVQQNDAAAVRTLKGKSAINFGGRNTPDVRSREVLEALNPGITNTPVATTTSTASATSTVTAATSRTTTSTTATTTTADTSFIPPSEGDAGSPKRG